jgi:DNA-binding CsgD family transcriptional regulator
LTARFEFTDQMMSKARSMLKRGCSLREIAGAIGCSPTTLRSNIADPSESRFRKVDLRRIRAMRKRGCSIDAIARAMNCSARTLVTYVHDLGSLNRTLSKEKLRQMATLHKEGRNLQEIAKALRTAPSTIGYHIHKLGLKAAGNGARGKSTLPVRNDIRRRVVLLRKRGLSFWKIAVTVKLSPTTVRAIVLDGGRPWTPRRRPLWQPVSKQEEKRTVQLRRAGSSLQHIAQAIGISASTVGDILRRNGFPGGRIPLSRLAGPVGARVRGICSVQGCGVRHYGSGLCRNHERQYKAGRINKKGRLLPFTCEDCGVKFHYRKKLRRCRSCARERIRMMNRLGARYRRGRIDEQGRPIPLICEQCGKKLDREYKARFCESCAVERQRLSSKLSARRRRQRQRQMLANKQNHRE